MEDSLYITPSDSTGSSASKFPPAAARAARDGKTPKREQVAAACLQCRSKKVKCDAVRPYCGRCRQRGLQCEYDVAEPDVTKLEAAKRRNEEMQDQLSAMRELYRCLATRSEVEAARILHLIRANPDDPFAVLRAVQEADLLLRRAAGARDDHDRVP
ncbi:hypothetical protein CERZMDRAFT_94795 [Cercospora zeae-maydis SCOH1-5]|uniref:Zn(2)-C6 fungal-type domain-containing protein n=1 Tax=Cercospora zeae-maydis SCOH1-5 TaxID=717836 RepID=A0A6A6FPN8_9PEZI|nr:hypothetical protein CERZMDRAFT_94795 [Cercospora zeae-maydis SCOH1-5]